MNPNDVQAAVEATKSGGLTELIRGALIGVWMDGFRSGVAVGSIFVLTVFGAAIVFRIRGRP